MKKKQSWSPPRLKNIGPANKLIQGFAGGKEIGGADGLFDPDDNPVS
tara:strand:+ start:1601 stop:1741 length:141 start_codon:yes stop_codon:yes gene_type:complete